MGTLIYDSSLSIEIEDRLLAHLRVVIGTKLRRGESFYFTWKEEVATGSGQTTVWMNASTNFAIRFSGTREIRLNARWIEELMLLANSSGGLRAADEPSPETHAP